MKMARASETDLKAALDVSRIIEDLERGYLPPETEGTDQELFDKHNPEDCRRAIESILEVAGRGSVFRVTFGMAVILDPRNEVTDPTSDILEAHPKIRAALADAERYRWLREQREIPHEVYPSIPWPVRIELGPLPTLRPCWGADLDAAVDAALTQEGDL